MKISETSSANPAAGVEPVVSPAKETEHVPATSSEQDEASVGPVALAASNSLDAPESRIAELRQQFLDGAYQVDANILSAKIVDEHLQE